MPRLVLLFLGSPSIILDDQVVRFDTRKAVALLAYLACQPGPHRRESLATLLWPEYHQSRAALRRTLSALQSVIGDQWLLNHRDSIALQRSTDLWIDIDAFRMYLANHHADGSALRAAVALHRDDFLAGFSLRDSPQFDDWQITQTEQLRLARMQTLERLIHLETSTGQLEAAITSARQLLVLDPLQEQTHRILMRLLTQTGQRSAALQQYRECVRMLDRELGVAPLDETTSLYQSIITGQLPVATVVSDPQIPIITPKTPAYASVTPLPQQLVGREREWERLCGAYHALQTDGQLFGMSGPSGIGKTRLATEFLSYAQQQAANCYTVRCYDGEVRFAYAPWIGFLQQIYQNPTAHQRLRQAPVWVQHELARLVPAEVELTTHDLTIQPQSQPLLFEAVRQALLMIQTTTAPLMLLLDDMHWADPSSLDLLAYLTRRLQGLALGLVVTWRPEELGLNHPLITLANDLRRTGQGHILQLTPLDRPAVQAFLQTAPDLTLPIDELIDPLFHETEGLPFLLVEYLTLLRNQPLALQSNWNLTGMARDLLHARLRHVSPLGNQILATAAVIGRSIDPDILRVASGRSEEEIVDGLEELTRLGIIIEGQSYDFSHGKLRDLIYAETSLARRRLLHRRVADACVTILGSAARAQQAGMIAQHYQQAGQLALAAGYFVLAGQHSRSLAALTTALDHFEAARALGVLDSGNLHQLIGETQTLLGQYDAALISYEAAAACSEVEQLVKLEGQIADIYMRRGDWELALRHLQAGLDLLPAGTADGIRVRLVADMSLSLHQAQRDTEAYALATEAHHLATQIHDQRALAQTHNLLGLLANDAGNAAQACAHLEQSLMLATRLRDANLRMAALNNLALAHAANGDPHRAIECAEQALLLCEAQGDRHRAAAIHNNIADFLHSLGDDTRARERVTRAVTLFASIESNTQQPHPAIWKLSAW